MHVVNLAVGLDPNRFEQLLVIGRESPAEGLMLDYALARGIWPHRLSQIVPFIIGIYLRLEREKLVKDAKRHVATMI